MELDVCRKTQWNVPDLDVIELLGLLLMPRIYGNECDCTGKCDSGGCNSTGTCYTCGDGFSGENCLEHCPLNCKDSFYLTLISRKKTIKIISEVMLLTNTATALWIPNVIDVNMVHENIQRFNYV